MGRNLICNILVNHATILFDLSSTRCETVTCVSRLKSEIIKKTKDQNLQPWDY